MSGTLAGQVAVVTGGAGGLGEAICMALAQAGCSVVVGYNSSADAARALAARLPLAAQVPALQAHGAAGAAGPHGAAGAGDRFDRAGHAGRHAAPALWPLRHPGQLRRHHALRAAPAARRAGRCAV
ncbi:SDR family NAD(P)-dependent oxidoreductase [Paucibacter sp. O1-1]|nr:SDR family NAD(P)-dependent oxidoreductase [Paucibacter sp. O1-1]MDA3830939.1 SDR family NAD(P)-dependent oxidoreductase [Paucibacter sp. O1-1]